jgi:hypothetical protein
MPRLTPADLADWRRALEADGDGGLLHAIVARDVAPRLMAEVEALWAEAQMARLVALREAAQLVDHHLAELARRGPPGAEGHGCVHCHDAEARRLGVALRERAEGRLNMSLTAVGGSRYV